MTQVYLSGEMTGSVGRLEYKYGCRRRMNHQRILALSLRLSLLLAVAVPDAVKEVIKSPLPGPAYIVIVTSTHIYSRTIWTCFEF
jgi:hypothetical protein